MMSECRVYLLPKTEQAKIISMCVNDNISPKLAGEKYQLPADTIRLFLNKEGYDISKLRKERFKNITKQATEEFISGKPMKDVTAKYQLSSSTIENYMRNNNILYKSEHGRKNFFNQLFFQNISSEASAYFLGFLFADGNISGVDRSYTRLCNISLCVSSKDRIVLENFLTCIEGSGNTRIRDYIDSDKSYKPSKMSVLSLTSTKMADDLIKLGFFGLKKDRINVPNLDKSIRRHFVRGYFEGDGCATTNTIQFTGYIAFLQDLMNLLIQDLALPAKEIKSYPDSPHVGDLYYCSQWQISRLYHYMYDDCQYFIPRKRDQIVKQLK